MASWPQRLSNPPPHGSARPIERRSVPAITPGTIETSSSITAPSVRPRQQTFGQRPVNVAAPHSSKEHVIDLTANGEVCGRYSTSTTQVSSASSTSRTGPAAHASAPRQRDTRLLGPRGRRPRHRPSSCW
jgi:hypothetical protein